MSDGRDGSQPTTDARRATEVTAALGVPLREYIEAVLTEQARALSMAEREREKAFTALRYELARSIEEGDSQLREHIVQQILQINAALLSADKLEQERIAATAARIESVAREILLIHQASERAVSKAESANEKRFADANEWRGQSADRERAHQETIVKWSGMFLQREVADAQFAELRRAVTDLTEKISKLV